MGVVGVLNPSDINSFKPGCLRFYAEVLFCALLRPFVLFAGFCGLAFALFCAHLRSCAGICVFLRPTAFRTTAFGNCGY